MVERAISMDLSTYVVNGIPLVAVILGLVELAKSFGASGRALTGISFGIGAALGIFYQFSVAIPATAGDWFGAVLFGLALGLTACKLYDAVRSAAKSG